MTFRYFHGHPGALEEVQLAGVSPATFTQTAPPQRNDRLIGFSLGAQAALQHAATQGAARVDLIAPAAPLQLGDFLPDMAGAPVFKAAQSGRLAHLIRLQAALLRLSPALLRRMMFATAPHADRNLFAAPENRRLLTRLLHHSLITHRIAYHAAIQSYVQDWSLLLRRVTCPVTLWHGTADTWAPPKMSAALTDSLSDATLISCQDLGHYSTLTHALPQIFAKDPELRS